MGGMKNIKILVAVLLDLDPADPILFAYPDPVGSDLQCWIWYDIRQIWDPCNCTSWIRTRNSKQDFTINC